MDSDKLAELSDRELIRETLIKHCAYADALRMDLMDEVWAEDCRTDFGPDRGGVIIGRDAYLERTARSLSRFNWTCHHVGGSVMDIQGDRATATTSVLAWHELRSGERCWVGAIYNDELRRYGHRWLIWSRETIVCGADGSMAEQNWNRLRRSDS